MASNYLAVCVSVDRNSEEETDQNLCTQKSIALLEMTIQSWTKLIIKFWHHHSQYKFAILSTPPHTPPASPGPIWRW